MEPGVPFSLLGAVQLLLIAAFAGLAVTTLLRLRTSSLIVSLGAAVLAGVEVRTALQLGVAASDDLTLLRCVGALLVGAGLLAGGLGSRHVPASLYGVVVPLAAGTGPAALAAGASLFAAGSVLWARRDVVAAWLAGGFVLYGVAAGLAVTADAGRSGPAAVLVLRGLAALAVLVALGLLAQVSLLSKVVGAILVGVLTMAIAAVGVVGNVVTTSYEKQNEAIVEEATASRLSELERQKRQNLFEAVLLSQACQRITCDEYLKGFRPTVKNDFVVRVTSALRPESLGGRQPLTPTEQKLLAGNPAVRLAFTSDRGRSGLSGIARLTGTKVGLAVIGVGVNPRAARPTGQAPPSEVFVYGTRLDQFYVDQDSYARGFGLSFLAGDPLQVASTNLSAADSKVVADIVRNAARDDGIPPEGETIGSEGTHPTVRVVNVKGADQQSVGLLVLSRDPGPALQARRDALRLLMVTALLALLLVALVATVLGRRTVEPVRVLTEAAQRIAAGDLSAFAPVRSRDEVGTLSRTFGSMTTSLGQLTGDLHDAAERLETVLASMSDGLLATDEDGNVTDVNRAALEMLGLEEIDVLGEHLSVVADVRDASGTQLANPQIRVSGEPADVHRPDGSRVPVRVEITSLLGAGGVVLVLRDTTREREVERMKTEFLSNVSHELRTPLTPIRAYAEMLVSRPNLGEERVKEFASVISDETTKMRRVVELLVDVATFETGRASVTPRPITVKELLDQRLLVWQTRSPKRRKDMKRRVASGLPAVYVDPVWLAKALDEFIDNAVKYTAPGVPITLLGGWSPDGTRVRVSVKDTGPGISEKYLETVFTSFEQVDGSATRRVGGLGLGLSFVRRLAEDAGYPLTVTTRPGKGAEFALDLPVSETPPPRRTKRS